MASAEIPNFKTYAEGESLPPVNPEDLKRRWNIKRPWSLQDLQEAWGHEADSSAVSSRDGMIRTLTMLNRGQLLTPWQRGEELDDAVFRIAATFPIRALKHKRYMIPGDEHFGFDPNAFVQRLVEETGIPHVWKPVATKVPEGGRACSFIMSGERDAKQQAQEVVWGIWSRFAPSLDPLLSDLDKEGAAEVVARSFADFLMDNIDLVRQVEASFRAGSGGDPIGLLTELEQKAQGRTWHGQRC